MTSADDPTFEAGMKVRRAVLGDAHVDRAMAQADAFTGDFQDLITRYAWGSIWSRPGLGRRERSLITLALLAALGHTEEIPMHVRGALTNGVTREEIKRGVPAHGGLCRGAYCEQRLRRREEDPRRARVTSSAGDGGLDVGDGLVEVTVERERLRVVHARRVRDPTLLHLGDGAARDHGDPRDILRRRTPG